MTRRRIGQLALGGCLTAAAVLALMWLVVLPSFVPPGEVPFDLRPRGYSFDAARDLMIALGPEGRWTYRYVQVPLDMVLALAYGVGIGCAILWLQGRGADAARGRDAMAGSGRIGAAIRSIFLGAPFLAAAFDLWENWLVFRMLGQGEGVSVALVAEASRTTTYKTAFVGIACAALVLTLLRALARRRRERATRRAK